MTFEEIKGIVEKCEKGDVPGIIGWDHRSTDEVDFYIIAERYTRKKNFFRAAIKLVKRLNLIVIAGLLALLSSCAQFVNYDQHFEDCIDDLVEECFTEEQVSFIRRFCQSFEWSDDTIETPYGKTLLSLVPGEVGFRVVIYYKNVDREFDLSTERGVNRLFTTVLHEFSHGLEGDFFTFPIVDKRHNSDWRDTFRAALKPFCENRGLDYDWWCETYVDCYWE